MDFTIVTDAVRYTHLLSVAIGLGASFVADAYVLTRLRREVSQSFIDSVRLFHTIVGFALAGMWISGLAMIYIRTGFDVAQFSPKLFTKIAVVSVLTLNAGLIGNLALPMIERSIGTRVLTLPLGQQFSAAMISGVSTTSWLLALALGESAVLKVSGWTVFAVVVPASYVCALVAAMFAITVAHWREPLPVR